MLNPTRGILLGLLCLAVGSRVATAQAANRWLVLVNADPTIAVDTTTLTKNPEGFPRAWIRMTFQSAQGTGDTEYISTMVRTDFNCAKRQINSAEIIEYAASGDVVLNTKQPHSLWIDVIPETAGEQTLIAFCKTRFSRL